MTIDQSSIEVLRDAIHQRTTIFFSSQGLDVTFQTHLLDLTGDYCVVENRVPPQYVRRFLDSSNFSIQVSMVRFKADEVHSDGQHFIFPLKDDSVIEETRQAERYPFTADERVVVEILNPYDNETRLSKSVMDMSATGLSLRTSFESDLFSPGTQLPSLTVLIEGEQYNRGGGRVVYRRKMMDLNRQMRLQIGIQFDRAVVEGQA